MGGMGSMGSPMPGPSYSGGMPMRPGMPQAPMDPTRKRFLQQQQPGGLMGPRRGLVHVLGLYVRILFICIVVVT